MSAGAKTAAKAREEAAQRERDERVARRGVPKNTGSPTAPKEGQQRAQSSRQLSIGPAVVVSVGIAFIMLVGWGVGLTGLLVFGDKLAPRLMQQQSELQDGYEQRVAALTAEIERLRNEQQTAATLTQLETNPESAAGTSVSEPMSTVPSPAPVTDRRTLELAQRLARLEARQAAVLALTDSLKAAVPSQLPLQTSPTASLPSASAPPGPRPQPAAAGTSPAAAPAPAPARPRTRPSTGPLAAPLEIEDDPRFRLQQGLGDSRGIALGQSSPAPVSSLTTVQSEQSGNTADRPKADGSHNLAAVERKLLQTETDMERSIAALSVASEQRIAHIMSSLSELGFEEPMVATLFRPAARVAPLQLPLSERSSPFGRNLEAARNHLARLAGARSILNTLPLSRPVASTVRTSSQFGFRGDPFLGTQRMHGGMDFAGPTGTPVYATGSGVVLSAGVGGGYGNLVQVNHGNGIVTRYAHLSAFRVVTGQPVAAGQIIGLVGSTGRSTGPHLHYEVRMEWEPNDPNDFIETGRDLRLFVQ